MGIYEDVALLQTQMQGALVSIENLEEYANYKALAENDDLNDLPVGHFYIPNINICTTISNRPDTTGQTAAIDVSRGGGTGQLIMVYRPCIKENKIRYVRAFYNNTWGEWLKFDDTDSGWLNLTLNSGWSMSTYDSEIPQYRKIGKVVYLRGLVNATATAGTDIATLPSGYAPGKGWFNRFACALDQNDSVIVQINNSGVIKDYTKTTTQGRSFLSLNGISFLID